MATANRTSAHKAQSHPRRSPRRPPSHAGSIADRLERSPGGIAGALARLEAAKASGRPMTALEKFHVSVGEELPAIALQPQEVRS